MGLDWNSLIEERNSWMAHNFPGDPSALNPVLGMIEELGELSHAHLKESQNIRGSSEEHVAAAQDAVADYTIYSLGVMHHWRCRPNGFPRRKYTTPEAALLGVSSSTGAIAQALLGHTIQPVHLTLAIQAAEVYCQLRDWDYEHLVLSTWQEVSKRDWIAFPHDGLTR